MNRFAQSRSVAFILLTWVFAACLFADGANLDDLFPRNLVLHDDEDVVSQDAMESTVWAASTSPGLVHPVRQLSVPGGPSKQNQDTPGRVVVDQDSPSLAADHLLGAIFEETGADRSEKYYHVPVIAAGHLYLRLCTLLI